MPAEILFSTLRWCIHISFNSIQSLEIRKYYTKYIKQNVKNQHVANRLMFGFMHHKPVIMSLTVQKWWLANFIWSVVLAASDQFSTVAAVTPRCFATHLNPLYYPCYVILWLLISALFLKGVLLLLSLRFGLQGMKLDTCGSLWTEQICITAIWLIFM